MTKKKTDRMKSHTERVRQQAAEGSIVDQECTHIVFRDPRITQALRSLEDISKKQLVRTFSMSSIMAGLTGEPSKQEVIIPLFEVESLFGYLLSDLSLFVQGAGDVRSMARSFFETQVFDQGEEVDQELYHGVLDEVVRVVNLIITQLRNTDFDHHGPHSYDLVRVLPSHGLLLIRAAYRS